MTSQENYLRKDLIVAVCRMHHSLLDHREIDIQPLTEANADGPLAFFERDGETGMFRHLVSERAVNVPETRGA